MGKPIKELVSEDGKRKVVIIRNGDDSFGFESYIFSEAEFENCWILYGRYSKCRVGDIESAEREACERVEWLAAERG